MSRFPPAAQLVHVRHTARLHRYRPDLPPLRPADAYLVNRLEHVGLAVTSLEELELAGTDARQSRLIEIVDTLSRRPAGMQSILWASHGELLADLELWRWGLDERLQAVAENHIGAPVTYHGISVARQVADGKRVGDRQWHLDVDDHRMLKVTIWLNDVDADGGPLDYVPADRTLDSAKALRYISGSLADNAVGHDAWRQQVGPQWTVTFTDPARVFHRVKPPTATDRYSATMTWTSRRPMLTVAREPFTADQIHQIRDGLTERQRACLPAKVRR